MKQFQNVILGGTFDLLHDGHKALLNKAFETGERVIIGITSDKMCQVSSIKYQVSRFETRAKELEDYLRQNIWLSKVKLIEINDKYGTTLTDQKLNAIVVSPETESVAKEINNLRLNKNWQPLSMIKIPWKLADDGKPINSVRIRKGEINRQGKLFILEKNWGERVLPDDLRTEFKKPMGKLIKSVTDFTFCHSPEKGNLNQDPRFRGDDRKKIIAVGDATVANFLKKNIIPDISIVDLKIKRRVVYQKVEDLGFRKIKLFKKVKNSPGTINYAAFQTLSTLIKAEAVPAVMQIIGEDDLLTLLAVFLAPLGSLIVYGQPREGMVIIEVNEKEKQQAREYLENFTKE